ncbi:hypothetical protein QE152_g40551 [Popillia japonica]|uniref:Reverse transcriptase n=1 Tax=Popillia japonica TaxID=7064 RepID=A0AAW1HG09_POPJA
MDIVYKSTPSFAPQLELIHPRLDDTIQNKFFDSHFSMDELEVMLADSRDSSSGKDRTKFSMYGYLPLVAKNFLLGIYNSILDTGTVPCSWRDILLVPLLKPGKPPEGASASAY